MSDSGEYYRITCRFCDTILTVKEAQAGKEIKCPDCFSMLMVSPPTEAEKSRRKKKASKAKPANNIGDSNTGDELKLSDTFERPAISPLFGLDASEEDLLAPRKRKAPADDPQTPAADETKHSSSRHQRPPKNAPPSEAPATNTGSAAKSSSKTELDSSQDIDLPLPVDEVLSMDAIGKLDPESETDADAGASKVSSVRPQASEKPREKQLGKKQRVRKQPRAKSSASEQAEPRRPKFEFANLFMATVGMLTDIRVLAASGAAVLVMLIGGASSEIIFPVGSNTEALTITSSMYSYFMSALFGYLPYYVGLLGLWIVAGIVFQHAAQGHVKVQHWTKNGQTEFLSSFLMFGFSFFVAGLPAAIFQMMIPLRMLVAPLFLISAWFNFSPWQIISTDWYHVISENKSQWITVYSCLIGLAFAGILTGGVFLIRGWTELVAVDLILTFIGIISNAVITLVFAAIAGWHTGAVIESLGDVD